MAGFNNLWWLLVLLVPFLISQRRLHREIQAVFLLITRRGEISLAMFSLLFFPGVFLHETSHFVVARLLGVRTGRFSLLPRPLNNGRLQLGFVETAATDVLRDALIGVAPLITGGIFVAYAGVVYLGLPALWENLPGSGPGDWMAALSALSAQPDFWLWFYLTFAVSSTMLPSSSDRRAWLPVTIIFLILLLLSLFAGAGPWLLLHMAPAFERFLQAVILVLGISLLIHLALLPPLWLFHRLLSRLTGMDVV